MRESAHLDIACIPLCSEYEDAAFMVNEFGQTPGNGLANSLLGPRVILINGCQVTARGDTAETGTHLSHSPVANMKMATGVLPAADVLHAGVNLGLALMER